MVSDSYQLKNWTRIFSLSHTLPVAWGSPLRSDWFIFRVQSPSEVIKQIDYPRHALGVVSWLCTQNRLFCDTEQTSGISCFRSAQLGVWRRTLEQEGWELCATEVSELAQMWPSTSLIQHLIPFDFSSPWPGAVNKSYRALSLFSSIAFWVALYAVGSRACLELVHLGISADLLTHQITGAPAV